MMIPPKLQHGDNLQNLFQKFNTVIDYLREIRLVAGNGIRINRLPAGTTIESTATATGAAVSSGGGGESAPGHPFDVKLLKNGTEENPQYAVRVYNSALPDSPYAGIVYIGTATYSVPVDEPTIEAEPGDVIFVDLVVTYSSQTYTITFEIRTDADYTDADNVFRETIAQGALPEIVSVVSSNIRITGRWL